MKADYTTRRAALILAGGKARRFQPAGGGEWQDKALAIISGKPLLIHAVESVRGVVDEVAVSVNDEQRKKTYDMILKANALEAVEAVVDEKTDVSGPTVAIMSGLKAVRSDYCLTLPCDMPYLQPEVAEYMFRQAVGFDVTVPMWPNGRLETLLTVLERHGGLEIAETLCKLARPRSDDIQRGAGKILFISPLAEIKTLDPELKSFININSEEELSHPQTRPIHGEFKENMALTLRPRLTVELQRLRDAADAVKEGRYSEAEKTFALCAGSFEEAGSFFWAAVSWEKQAQTLLRQVGAEVVSEAASEAEKAFLKAAGNYQAEVEMYRKNRCVLLAERAFADKTWCEAMAEGKRLPMRRHRMKEA